MGRIALAFSLVVAALAQPGGAQAAGSGTNTRYAAPTGSVSPELGVTMNLADGGSAFLNPVLGPNCYYGSICGFPAGYVGTYMSYSLADGSSATLPAYHGTFAPYGTAGNSYLLSGVATGTDSFGRPVRAAERVYMTITCRSGRGGGCSKIYDGGVLRVTVQ